MLAELPQLLRDKEAALARRDRGESIEQERSSITANTSDLYNRLQLWRTRWELDNPNECFEVEPSFPLQFKIQSMWPTMLGFTSTQAYSCIITYNSILIIVLKIHVVVYETNDIEIENQHCDITTNFLTLLRTSLTESCRCMSHLFTVYPNGGEGIYVLLQLRHVWLATRQMTIPEAKWLDNFMTIVSQESGEELWLNATTLPHFDSDVSGRTDLLT